LSSSNWLELHSDLPDHPKVMYCASLLKVDPDLLIGKLCRLWLWALNNRESGKFLACETSLIADKMRWNKKADNLISALCSIAPGECAGFLYKTEDGYEIYHWQEYAGRLLDKRRKDRERKAERAAQSNGNSNGNPPEIHPNNKKTSDGMRSEVAGITLNPLPLTPNELALSAREESPESEFPEMTEEAFNALSGFGILYEQTTGSPVPSALAEQLRFRLAEHADPELVKEALRQSIGKRNEGAYLNAIMQSWTAKGIKTYRQYLDTVPQTSPSAKRQQPSISDPANYQEQREEDLPEWARKPVN
jgi:DnaD/phage-associated family protein